MKIIIKRILQMTVGAPIAGAIVYKIMYSTLYHALEIGPEASGDIAAGSGMLLAVGLMFMLLVELIKDLTP